MTKDTERRPTSPSIEWKFNITCPKCSKPQEGTLFFTPPSLPWVTYDAVAYCFSCYHRWIIPLQNKDGVAVLMKPDATT